MSRSFQLEHGRGGKDLGMRLTLLCSDLPHPVSFRFVIMFYTEVKKNCTYSFFFLLSFLVDIGDHIDIIPVVEGKNRLLCFP